MPENSGPDVDPADWPRERHGTVEIARHPRWTRLAGDEDTMVLAYPAVSPGTFRPNVVVRRKTTSGSLAALAAQGIAGVLGGIDGAHCLSNDRGEVAGRPARGQLFVYHAAEHSVLVDRWLFFAGTDAVEVSAQYTVEQQEDMAGLLPTMLAQCSVEDAEPAGGSAMPEPLAEPRLDAFVSRAPERNAESVAKVSVLQPYRAAGPVLSDAALQLVMDQAGRPRLGRLQLLAQPGLAAELVAAGLMEPDGAFTEAFGLLTLPFRQRRLHIRVEGAYGTRATQLDLWVGGGGAMVAARPSHAQLVVGREEGAVPPGAARVEAVREASIPGTIAAWAGLGPAWTALGNIDRVPLPLFRERLAAGAELPDGADAATARMWEQPWFAWRFTLPEHGMQRAWLNAGDAGHYATGTTDDGAMMMQPTPSAHVWRTMSQETGAALQLR
ncbi:hypothetical protein ACX8Z9_03195 [Arthrobacter halodurans]|uniref:Uncharacterized protein n=1 Tax=Arthrobacter halodurans TaxID=516699 RepID=A0ABV4UJX2_9MICC